MKEGRTELFELLAGMNETMVFVTDLATAKTLYVNEALVKITGYTLEDYQFERFENPFIPAEDIAVVGQFIQEFMASDATTSGIVRNRFVDRWGGTLHVRTRLAKMEWQQEPALLYSTVLDKPQAEHSIEAQQRYRSLVEAASDSIVRLRSDRTLQFSNRSFQNLVGRTPVALNILPFGELVLESHREQVRELLDGNDQRFQMTVPLEGADGEPVWVEGTFVRILSGEDVGLLHAILRDVTAKRRLTARMQQAQKRESLGEMAGGVAHDLGNILTCVLGAASLGEHMVEPGTMAAEAFGDIQIAARRAGELSASMLAYAGKAESQSVVVDLGLLTAEMKSLLASGLSIDVVLRVQVSDTPIPVLADEIQLRQVVMNLITNAADATTTRGGEVQVEALIVAAQEAYASQSVAFGTRPKGERVALVRVSDHGCGMSQKVLQKIFDPFFSTKAKGRGLGLAAALGILEHHGGCILVRTTEGEGTVMEIVLPLHSST